MLSTDRRTRHEEIPVTAGETRTDTTRSLDRKKRLDQCWIHEGTTKLIPPLQIFAVRRMMNFSASCGTPTDEILRRSHPPDTGIVTALPGFRRAERLTVRSISEHQRSSPGRVSRRRHGGGQQ